jgi:hypothetical protein
MKAFWLAALSVVALLSASCNRQDSSNSEKGTQIQPGGIAEESEQWGFLALRIVKVHEKQKALDTAPWFAAGGEWTFLECESEKDSNARVLIGASMRRAPKGDFPANWGEATITVADASAGAQFIKTFAKGFHMSPPPSHGQKPPLQVKMQTAVLGTGLSRDPRGGFKDGRNGSWVATNGSWRMKCRRRKSFSISAQKRCVPSSPKRTRSIGRTSFNNLS